MDLEEEEVGAEDGGVDGGEVGVGDHRPGLTDPWVMNPMDILIPTNQQRKI